jgi:hypothetical protein
LDGGDVRRAALHADGCGLLRRKVPEWVTRGLYFPRAEKLPIRFGRRLEGSFQRAVAKRNSEKELINHAQRARVKK